MSDYNYSLRDKELTMARTIFDGEVKVVDKVKPRKVKRNKAIAAAVNKALKNPEPHYVSGLELPVGMRIEVVDRMVYFITDDKRDLLTLHRKLEQTSIAARDAFYGK